MPDAVEVAIESALINRAVAFAAAQVPVLTISLPNVPFTPPPTTTLVGGVTVYGKYLRATFLPADGFSPFLATSADNQHYGIFQVDVFYGQGAGEYAPGRIATAVIAWFKRGTRLTKDGFTVKIGAGRNIPRRGSLVKDDPWVFIPVSIPYLCFAPNP